jgi:signal transduction histidine kinase
MSQRCFLILFFLLLATGPIYSQATLKELDKLKNDSAAIAQLENYMAITPLTAREKLDVMFRISSRAGAMRDFPKEIKVTCEGIALAQKNNLDSMEAVLTKLLGITYYMMGQQEPAIAYFKKAITIAHEHGHWFTESRCYSNLGAIYQEMKQFKLSEHYLMSSINLMEAHHKEDDPATGITYRLLATLYTEMNQPGKAESIYKQFIEKSRKIKDTTLLCSNLIYYSNLLAARGDLNKALAMTAEALACLRKRGNNSDLLAAMHYHATHLSKAGRFREALDLQDEQHGLMKKSFSDDLKKQISELDVKYKTEELKREKELAEIKARKEQQLYLFGFTGLFILLITLFYVFTQRKNSRQKIAFQQQRLETLIEGEEKERSRIARDLHDGIVQDLTAIKLKTESTAKTNPLLNEISLQIDKAAKEIRNMAYQMMPIALREYGLVASLEDLLQKTLAPAGIQFDFETVHIEERLPEKIEVCLYRITQELLNNAVKHSKADFVSLVITKQADAVSLIFEDNGKGFNQNNVKKGLGMNSLSSRLEIVNGELKFETSEGSGTMAIIRIPCYIT